MLNEHSPAVSVILPAYNVEDYIAEARGKFIARQDGDDINLPTRLAEQVAYLEANLLFNLR